MIAAIEKLNWNVGDLMKVVKKYCIMGLNDFNSSESFLGDQTPTFTFFEYILFDMYHE